MFFYLPQVEALHMYICLFMFIYIFALQILIILIHMVTL